jgi:hypothetical protein
LEALVRLDEGLKPFDAAGLDGLAEEALIKFRLAQPYLSKDQSDAVRAALAEAAKAFEAWRIKIEVEAYQPVAAPPEIRKQLDEEFFERRTKTKALAGRAIAALTDGGGTQR